MKHEYILHRIYLIRIFTCIFICTYNLYLIQSYTSLSYVVNESLRNAPNRIWSRREGNALSSHESKTKPARTAHVAPHFVFSLSFLFHFLRPRPFAVALRAALECLASLRSRSCAPGASPQRASDQQFESRPWRANVQPAVYEPSQAQPGAARNKDYAPLPRLRLLAFARHGSQ